MITREAPPFELEQLPWARAAAVGPGLWRITGKDGRVLGHVRSVSGERGGRFTAERFSAPAHGFHRLGEFWSAREALECLRYAR